MMQHLISALDRIKLIPGARVDRCFLQGRDAMLSQLELRLSDQSGEPRALAISLVDDLIASTQAAFEELQERIEPYQFPESYSFFQQFCGGFTLDSENYRLLVDGIGPMVDEWYGYLLGDDVFIDPNETGLLQIAQIQSEIPKDDEYLTIFFFIDLAGVIQEDAVIGIAPSQGRITPIIEDFDAYPDHWKVLAPSFAEWLELVADTDGLLGYEF
jgi:hypothetical protein